MAEKGSNGVAQAKQHVRLKIKCNKDRDEVLVSVNRSIRIRRLLVKFCQHASLDYRSTRFVIDNRTFSHDKTANQLGLVDDDQIDALIDGNGA